MSKNDPEKGRFLGCGCLGWACACALGIFVLVTGVAFPPSPGGIKHWPDNACQQTARTIGVSMFSYSNDNDGAYPDGKSSTEVFQKLMDGGYISDPNIFYIPMSGKSRPLPGQKLKPENICWDVTAGVDSHSPDGVPIVFLTGYKVTYAPGGSAVPIVKPFPKFGLRTWSQWLNNEQFFGAVTPGLAVAYKGNSAKFVRLETAPDGTGSVPNFIPPDFKPDGKTYRQLTPDGPLPQ